MFTIDVSIQMWAVFALIAAALFTYACEVWPIELTSLAVIAALLVFFFVFPVRGPGGEDRLDPAHILRGFANPALITVVGLLVVGEGLKQTGVLDRAAQVVFAVSRSATRSIAVVLIVVAVISAFLNNIPVVVMFIPIMQALADRVGRSSSQVLIPLSFVAVLGGMTTLIGSSTNMLVAGELGALGLKPFGFFEFTVPGLVLAGTGFLYSIFIAPRLLPARATLADRAVEGSGKHFIAQLAVLPDSKLIGTSAEGGLFPTLPGLTVRMIQQGDQTAVPPFEEVTIGAGDMLIVAATRKALTEALQRNPGLAGASDIGDDTDEAPRKLGTQMIAEVMITPSSRMIGLDIEQADFRKRCGCTVLGVQRRSRMIRGPVTRIKLEAGDVLLVQGPRAEVRALRRNPDLLLMEWSARDLPRLHHGRRAVVIFGVMVAAVASGAAPIVVATVAGVVAMIAAGCLNVRQAAAAIDRNIVLTIAMALALGAALQQTGGANYLADGLVRALGGASHTAILSGFFLLVAVLSNVVSTKAAAVLFTPIAVSVAGRLGADPLPFAVAVVFAANCSFASPIGYQTNLLVMAPGQYRFLDFTRAGLPLIFILWVAFTAFAPWYYGFK